MSKSTRRSTNSPRSALPSRSPSATSIRSSPPGSPKNKKALTPSQKAQILADAIEAEEEQSTHRIGAVYADPAVRRKLANGQGPTKHAELLEKKYLQLIADRKAKRDRALHFRRNVGRIRGPDRNVMGRNAEKITLNKSNGEKSESSVADMLTDACVDLFPSVRNGERVASDIPGGNNPLDGLPIRDSTMYNAKSGHGRHHGGSHRSKHGPHDVHPIAPPPKPPAAGQGRIRPAYGSNRYGRAPVPVLRYNTGADIGLQKECSHMATFGTHYETDRGVLRKNTRQANLGSTTLGNITATRRTSPRQRLLNLKKTGQMAKQVVFSHDVEEAAVDFLACASVKKKYVPPGAANGSKSIFAQKLWKALKKKPGFIQTWTKTIAETFARDLFSDRPWNNLKAAKELRKAFAIGTKILPKYTDSMIQDMKRQRVERIHAVVMTPCLVDRLVEFVSNETSTEQLVTEAAVCLAAIVCTNDYDEDHIDEILRCVVDRSCTRMFMKRVEALVSATDQESLKNSDLPDYLRTDEKEEEKQVATDVLEVSVSESEVDIHGNGIIDYSKLNNGNLIIKCHLGHVVPYDVCENASERYCDNCAETLGDDGTQQFSCTTCEWSMCDACVNIEKSRPNTHGETNVGGICGVSRPNTKGRSRPTTTSRPPTTSRPKTTTSTTSKPSTTDAQQSNVKPSSAKKDDARDTASRKSKRYKHTSGGYNRGGTASSSDGTKDKIDMTKGIGSVFAEAGEKELQDQEEEEEKKQEQDFNLKEDKDALLYKELKLAAAALSPLLRVIVNVPPRRYRPSMVEPIRRPRDDDGWLPRRSLNADHSIVIKKAKILNAISTGQIVQIVNVNEITENEDVIWLMGTNQGTEKSNTYLATKSNGQFENSPSEGGKREMGMGVPETGNSGWGIMLAVTSGGERRGFSFERRGKAYRYVEDWMMENEEDEMTEVDYSNFEVLDAVHEGIGMIDSIAPGKGLHKIGKGVVIKMMGATEGGRLFKITKGGLTEEILNNLPKVGQQVKYRYCKMDDNGLPTFPALTDDYIPKKNIGKMHIGTGKMNWKKIGLSGSGKKQVNKAKNTIRKFGGGGVHEVKTELVKVHYGQ